MDADDDHIQHKMPNSDHVCTVKLSEHESSDDDD